VAKKRTTKSAKRGKPAKRRPGTRATAKKRSASKRPAAKKRPAASVKASARKAAKKKATPKTNTRTARKKNAARSAASRSIRQERKPKEPSKLASAATAVKGAMANAVAAVAKRLPGAKPDMDAITLLETDHRRLEDLLKQGEATTERAVKGRTELLGTLTAELAVHELIEEKILYPALKEHPEAREIVLEGFQEHHVADIILKELHQVARDDEQWGAKFKVLKENIEHHIKEEEGPMFRTARGVMSREDLQGLGAQMAKMKSDAEQGKLPR
jgi:hemerythrin-like domain-containing protein